MKMILAIVYLLVHLFRYSFSNDLPQENVDVLIKNLFDNLAEDPYLQDMENFNSHHKKYIDVQVKNFLDIFKSSTADRGKRSLLLDNLDDLIQDEKGVFKLERIKPFGIIPAKYPRDIEFFINNNKWYVATLEASGPKEEDISFNIYSLRNGTFHRDVSMNATRGIDLACYPGKHVTFIAIVKNATHSIDRSVILTYNYKDKVTRIQHMDAHEEATVAFWEFAGNIYLALGQFKINLNVNTSMVTTIYKWAGRHFDIVQYLNTQYVKKIKPFKIRSHQYLAIANYQDDTGNTKTYSDIYKFNMHTERFELHQRIRTEACTDIEFFDFKDGNKFYEGFLVTANSFRESDGKKTQVAESIIYKLVGNHFIPFQSIELSGLQQWLPIQAPEGQFALAASCRFDGLKIYQYDGWSFVETHVELTTKIFKELNNLASPIINNMTTLVISNSHSDEKETNMFEVVFTHKNELSEFQRDMLKWCGDTNKRLDNIEGLARNVSKLLDDAKIHENTATHEMLKAEPSTLRARQSDSQVAGVNTLEPKPTRDQQMQIILDDLLTYRSLLDSIEETIQKPLVSRDSSRIERDLSAEDVIVEGDTLLRSLHTNTMNGFQINETLSNVLDINEGFHLDEIPNLEFTRITDDEIRLKFLNDHPIEDLVHSKDMELVSELNIKGYVNIENELLVKGKVNNITLTEKIVLLKNGDQSFGECNIRQIDVDNLEVETINNFEMKHGMCKNIDVLNTTNLFVDGYINGQRFPTLNKNVLRISGNQNITGTYTFDNLEADNVNVKLLNDEHKPSDLIDVTKPVHWKINSNLIFENEVSANNLTVTRMLNNIKVVNGKLDILMRESDEPQYITGMKRFENLTLLNPMLSKGPIQGPGISKLNPVKNINKDIELVKNITIEGDVTIEDLLELTDIHTGDPKQSVKKLLQSGLKLEDKHIPLRLNFSQQINIAEIIADEINGVDVDTWVINGGENQIISGLKVFAGDLSIHGPSSVSLINHIDVKNLEQNVLYTHGNQTIVGQHTVKKIVANGIAANKILHAGHELSALAKADDNSPPKTSITVKSLKAKNCKCRNMNVTGSINGKNLTKIMEDTFTKQTVNATIGSHKNFTNLWCKHVETKVDPEDIFYPANVDLSEELLEIDIGLNLKKPIYVHNITFIKTFNGKSIEELGNVEGGNKFTLYGNHSLKKLVVTGKVSVASGHINQVKIDSLLKDTMKIDEPMEFDTLRVGGTITVPKITLKGQIEGLDIHNAVMPGSKETQVISGEKTFLNDLIVTGNVAFTGKINGMSQEKFFSSVSPNPEKDKVLIEGSVVFPKGPEIEVLNGRPLEDLSKRIWFKNRPTILTGNMNFQDIEFRTNITVDGEFGTLNLASFEKRYFSRSKNHTAKGVLEFENITFKQNVSTPIVDLHGRLNTIKLEEFIETILLDNVDQTFEQTVFIENCEAKGVKGDYKINGLDIARDVMRYDVKNIVTGMKNISYLDVHDLQLRRDIKIQNVAIVDTIKRAVFKNKPASLSGKNIFTNFITFSGNLSVHGKVNGKSIDSRSVMLKNTPQTISGAKTFISTKLDPIKFKNLKLKGKLNGLLLQDITRAQANKDEDNVFKSTLNFNSNISTKNLNIMHRYQGVNVTELLSNLTTLQVLSAHERIYDALLAQAQKLYTSLKDQANYLHYYKVVGIFEDVDIIPITYNNKVDALITLRKDLDAAQLEFYEWNHADNMYATTNKSRSLKYCPSFVKTLTMYDEDCLYVEYRATKIKAEQQGLPYTGEMISIDGHRNFNTYAHIPSNGTSHLSTITLPGYKQNCLVFTYVRDNYVHIMCDQVERKFSTFQSFSSEGVSQVVTVLANKIPYIITMNSKKGNQETDYVINVRKFSLKTRLFHPSYTIHERYPVYMDAVVYNGETYLAIASGYTEKSIHAGAIHIRRYNPRSSTFEPWQVLTLEAPIEVKFAVLPSNELVLYATTKNPSRPLVIYMYEGISRFVQKMVASAIERAEFVRHVTNRANQHFIITGNGKEVNVMQAVFKGEKWNFT